MQQITETPSELPSVEEFMKRFSEALTEAGPMGDTLKFVITTLHRTDVDEAATNLALYVNTEEGISSTLRLTTDQVLELMDVMIQQPDANLPSFGIRKIKEVLMSIYDGECDEVVQSEELAKYIDLRTSYQGLMTEVIITLTPVSRFRVTLAVSAEYFLDTREEEDKLLREKGIDHIHQAQVVNHSEQILLLSAESIIA